MEEHALSIKMQSQYTKTESEVSSLQQTKEQKRGTISLFKSEAFCAVMPVTLQRESDVSEAHVVSIFNAEQ
jgi:hypothetical protein